MAAKSKCHVCHQRKGKRPCPARSAPICARCCAQHRVVEIDCPVDCPFLGAEGSMLLAARQGGDAPLTTSEDIHAFASELMDLAPAKHLIDDAEPTALDALNQLIDHVDEADEDATVQGAIFEWLMFGALDSKGHALVDRIVTRLPRPLTDTERAALRAMHDCRYGLFTLESLPTPDTAKARDLLADAVVDLFEPSIAENHEAGDTLACFVVQTHQGLEVITGAWKLPEDTPDRFTSRLRDLRDDTPLSDIPLTDFLTRHAIVIPLLMFEHFGDHQSGDPDFPPPSF